MSNWIPTTNNTFDAHAEVFTSADDPEVRITLGSTLRASEAGRADGTTDALRSFVVQTDQFCITGYTVQQDTLNPTGDVSIFFAGTGQQVSVGSDYGTVPATHSYWLHGDGIGVVTTYRPGDGFDKVLTALYRWAARYARTHLGVAA